MTESKVFDHLGNEYPTLRAMCSAYGTTAACYLKRIERGASKRDALTVPTNRHFYKYQGHIFKNKAGLMAYAGVAENDFWLIEDKVILI